VINFQHPRLQFSIQHNIKTQQLKAAIGLLALTRLIDVLQLRLDRQHGLNDDQLDFLPKLICWFCAAAFTAFLRHLAAETIWDFKFVDLFVKVLVLLVEGVIGQVDEVVVHVFLGVLFGG
jgi:hypothetical protein